MKLFSRGAFLAVVGDDDQPFWLCKTVYQVTGWDKRAFDIRWLEKADGDGDVYKLSEEENSLGIESVICRVFPRRTKNGGGGYVLGKAQIERVERCMDEMAEGRNPVFNEDTNGFYFDDIDNGESLRS